MPITIPPFVAYQSPLVPLRGLWNHKPVEGDRFCNAEINWGITTGAGNAVQINIGGNSPVEFSQIAAMSVDNSRCGVDAAFLFPDSGFELVVPAYNQGVYPVYTNALSFFAVAAGSQIGDRTVFQVLNSNPPPVAIQPSSELVTTTLGSVSLAINATTNIIPTTINGTIQGLSVQAVASNATATQTSCVMQLIDGAGTSLWVSTIIVGPNSAVNLPQNLTGLRLRFVRGVSVIIGQTSIVQGQFAVNIYYSVP